MMIHGRGALAAAADTDRRNQRRSCQCGSVAAAAVSVVWVVRRLPRRVVRGGAIVVPNVVVLGEGGGRGRGDSGGHSRRRVAKWVLGDHILLTSGLTPPRGVSLFYHLVTTLVRVNQSKKGWRVVTQIWPHRHSEVCLWYPLPAYICFDKCYRDWKSLQYAFLYFTTPLLLISRYERG